LLLVRGDKRIAGLRAGLAPAVVYLVEAVQQWQHRLLSHPCSCLVLGHPVAVHQILYQILRQLPSS